MITLEQQKDVMDRADALARYLDIDRKKIEFEEEDLRTQAPDFWDDPERARAQMKVVGELKKWIEGYAEPIPSPETFWNMFRMKNALPRS